ncbi:unnamed protein product [Mytilus coruscus]|uniref:Mab-21-like nucleotidyltransferase domain-containing protein n=1 Tax=Mytilus coruscus TaxID=42192 RepID=A0A6J8E465_MYTCO|nr:unnamed protein product [Mytilus coruscus]
MNHTEEELSLEFYHYLCNIVGSEDVVKTRRSMFTVMDYVQNGNGMISQIISGSKAEGLDTRGSDIDKMIVFCGVPVYENINNVTYNPAHLLIETNDTKPGFAKLKLSTELKNRKFFLYLYRSMLCTLGEETFISSKRFREYFLTTGTILHGPCISVPGDICDIAYSFRCKEWITSAQPWIYRPRSTWPDYKLVTSIVQNGCTPDKIWLHLARSKYNLEEQTVFERMHREVGLIATCKNLIIRDFVFYYPFILLPTELTRLPRLFDRIYVPSVVYCHVLLFLCFHHLRDVRGKLNALHDLQLTIRERYFISHDEITLKMVYQCLDIVKALV